jgi:hypothetical protein
MFLRPFFPFLLKTSQHGLTFHEKRLHFVLVASGIELCASWMGREDVLRPGSSKLAKWAVKHCTRADKERRSKLTKRSMHHMKPRHRHGETVEIINASCDVC